MNLVNSKRERIRFLKFAFVGLTGTIVDFGVMNLLRLILNTPLVLAQAISFICAVINNFIWNRYWTYPESKDRSAHKQLLQFFIINIIGILIRTPLVPWINNLISNLISKNNWALPMSNKVISQNIALALSIAVVTLWNYFANRYWTYNNVPIKNKKEKSINEQ
jgi:putative flippase GtrA